MCRAVLTEEEKLTFDEAVEGVLEEHVNSAAAARWREWGDLRLYGDFVNVHGFYTELDRGAAMDYVRRAARRLDRDRRREGRESAAPGDLVITRNEVELFCRMKRILKMPGGHLVGFELDTIHVQHLRSSEKKYSQKKVWRHSSLIQLSLLSARYSTAAAFPRPFLSFNL